MRVTVIGAGGFVGSAFARQARSQGFDVLEVTRANYDASRGTFSDIVVDASANSSKLLAERRPREDFGATVIQRMATLHDFPADIHLHVSSVDVYPDLDSPATTTEDTVIDPLRQSHYGFNKYLAEQCVRHFARRWLIVRLAGMVGPGLKKNPVFDILEGQPLRIHPASEYQFMGTDDVARLSLGLVERGCINEIYNVCGTGLISPESLAALANRPLVLTALPPGVSPRIVHVSTARLERLTSLPSTEATIRAFLLSRDTHPEARPMAS